MLTLARREGYGPLATENTDIILSLMERITGINLHKKIGAAVKTWVRQNPRPRPPWEAP
jgi:hypothetical protein